MSEENRIYFKLAPGKFPQIKRFWRWLTHATRAEYWFPHLPLALGLALAGYLLMRVSLGPQWQVLVSHPEKVFSFPPSKMPYLLIGIAMMVMGAGLLFRSRFVWITALVLTVAAIPIVLKDGYSVIGGYNVALLLGLLAANRSFNRISLAAGTLFALTSSLLLLMYAVFGSYYLGVEFRPPITNLLTAFYFSVVTMCTVGYGDIIPTSPEARLFAVSIMVLGVAVFATSITAIVAPMVTGSLDRMMSRKRKRMKRSNHFVIIGATPLAYNTYHELKRRNQIVSFVLSEAPPSGEIEEDDLLIGDPNNLEVLRRADADHAQAVLAMRADDSENAFIVLAVKELKGNAKTIATLNDSKHAARVKLVGPDLLIAPQALGGELLAMVLSGERIDGESLIERFFHFEQKPDENS